MRVAICALRSRLALGSAGSRSGFRAAPAAPDSLDVVVEWTGDSDTRSIYLDAEYNIPQGLCARRSIDY